MATAQAQAPMPGGVSTMPGAFASKQDVDEGRPCDPLSVDLRDHFRKTLGLRKLANQKVAETINATKHLMSKSRRVFDIIWT